MSKKYIVAQGVPAQMLENYLNQAIPEGYELSSIMIILQEDDITKYRQAESGNVISLHEEPQPEPVMQVIPFAYPIFKKV